MNKKGRIQMRGRFYFAQTRLQASVHVLDAFDCFRDPRSSILDCCSPRESERLLDEKQQYYIVAEDTKVYRVAKQEIPEIAIKNGDLEDGYPVSFETPATQRGKFRWAYNIQQVI